MLRLEGVSKLFNPGTVDEKIALAQINLHLKKGDFMTIIGSNGAGKSTLMNVISGTLAADTGKVLIAGQEVQHLPEHKRSRYIARVFQDPMAGTAPNMTIQENLAMAFARNQRRGLRLGINAKKKKLFREQLSRLGMGLESRLNAKVGLLSGGERQALSLLMSTFTEPEILLLDEHTAALDPSRAELVLRLTQEMVEEFGLTTLMVTHNMEQAIRLGNRLIMMDKGRIILDVSGEEKKKLTVGKLLQKFEEIRGEKLANDRLVLN